MTDKLRQQARNGTYHRSGTFVHGAINEKARTVEISFSSEASVPRLFGNEILDHSLSSVRLNRLNDGAALLWNHDPDDQLGVVESARVDHDRRGRAIIRFAKTQRAEEAFSNVIDGILQHVSVGYRIHALEQTSGGDDGETNYLVTDWEPFEISVVSVPADASVGVGRNFKKVDIMEIEKTGRTTRSQRRSNSLTEGETGERKRASDIMAIGAKHGCEKIAHEAVRDGWDIQRFQDAVLESRSKNDKPIDPVDIDYLAGLQRGGEVGFEYDRYSLQAAIRAISDPKSMAGAGFELEVSQELQRKMGRSTTGLLVPLDVLNYRSVTKTGTSSATIATDVLDGGFIDVLRARSQVMALNPTVLNGLVGDVAIPKKSSGASAYWIDGDDSDALTPSDVGLGQVTMTPKTVGGAVTFSHKMLVQSSPDIEALIRKDLADLLAVEIDKKAIQGDGAGNTPTGIINQSGIGSTTYSLGGSPDFADVISLETTLSDANADNGFMAYLTTPTLAGKLKGLARDASNGQGFIWEPGKEQGEGLMNGYLARKSSNVPAGYMVFGNWQDLLIGFWGALEISADPYGSNFLKGSVTVRVLADVDIAARHGESFAEIHEAAS